MKYSFIIFFSLLFISASCASCKKETAAPTNADTKKENGNISTNPTRSKMKIKIGARTFNAVLYDNATATAFKARLPVTIKMQDLNSNEKYFDFSSGLPTNSANPGTIQSGDLMLYGNKTLVLFYKSFPTSYSYTELGRIDNTSGLTAALGTGNVTVTFELE
jgi:hypothetical protein